MQLKANTYYRTESGLKAFVAAIGNPLGNCQYPAIGWIAGHSSEKSWDVDGRYGCGSEFDLIAEWTERSVELTVDGKRYRCEEIKA